MKAAALARGEELDVHVEWQSCNLDPRVEIDIVANYITRGFDVSVIEPVNPVEGIKIPKYQTLLYG